MALRRRQKGMPTTMVDLCFVLVGFFLLTSSMVKDGETTTAKIIEEPLPWVQMTEMVPSEGEAGDTGFSVTNLTIKKEADGVRYYLGDKSFSSAELGAALKRESAKNVAVRADNAVPVGSVMETIALCRKNGVKQYTLVHLVGE